MGMNMYEQLNTIHQRPEVFSVYTADLLWTDPHLANQMLQTHLNQDTPLASRPFPAIDRVVDWLDQTFQLNGKAVCDLGCGPGLYAERFARRGATVHGVDFSVNSIAYAKENSDRHGGRLNYHVANYLTDPLPRDQDLATLIYCDFCPLSPTQRRTLFAQIRASLKPSGTFVFDVVSKTAFESVVDNSLFARNYMGGFWSAGDYFAFHNTYRYETEAVGLDHFTIVEANRSWDVYNWLQYFNADDIRSELTTNGFDLVDIVDGFDEVGATNTTFGVISKPVI
jgi:SAM-dependent methyltransferase